MAYKTAQYGSIARLLDRFGEASRHGPVAVAGEAHRMAANRLHAWFLERIFDDREPQDVGATVDLEGLTINTANAVHGVEYTPTPKLVVRWILSSFGDGHAKYDFVDFGSGLGRVVAQAMRFPFRSVTGIEFARELHEGARRHIAGLADTKILASSVNMIHGDATTADLPAGPCIMFLYNPFGAPVLRTLSERIIAKFQGKPEKSIVLYYNPVHRDVFDSDSRYERIELPRLLDLKLNWLGPHRFVAYRVK